MASTARAAPPHPETARPANAGRIGDPPSSSSSSVIATVASVGATVTGLATDRDRLPAELTGPLYDGPGLPVAPMVVAVAGGAVVVVVEV